MTPRLSVVTIVAEASPETLRSCLASLRRQTFADWEHVVIVERPPTKALSRVLASATRTDPRVKVIADTGSGERLDVLTHVAGEIVAVVGEGDVLEPEALTELDAVFHGEVDVAYCDHDHINEDGFYVDAFYKPDFSPELLRAQNYVGPLVLARRDLLEAVGGWRGKGPAAEHDLALRLTERARRVAHVPRVLYHARRPSVGTAESPDAARAIADHCRRVGIDATVAAATSPGCYRVVRAVHDRPLVSVVIPTRGTRGRVWGLERCFVVEAVRSVVERSTYRELEFVIVHDAATPTAVLDELHSIDGAVVRLVRFEPAFNFSAKINLGVAHAEGPLLLLLNDDVELLEPTSIEVLVAHLESPDVAMAGAKLLFADGTLQHGGHVYTGLPEHACFGWRGDSPGPVPRRPLAVERECSGVTAGCALVRTSAFEEVGGFPTDLPYNYNDADFSLRLRAAGYRIIWTPWASWYHFESQSRGRELPTAHEQEWMRARWPHELAHDPYYNPNLAPSRNDFLESPDARPALWREP